LKLVFEPEQIELLPVITGVTGNALTINTEVACDEQEFPSVRVTVYVPLVLMEPVLGPDAAKLEGPVQLKLPGLKEEAVNVVVAPLHIELFPAIEGVLGREFTVNVLVACEEQLLELVKITV
jgi:hypothetical protein